MQVCRIAHLRECISHLCFVGVTVTGFGPGEDSLAIELNEPVLSWDSETWGAIAVDVVEALFGIRLLSLERIKP